MASLLVRSRPREIRRSWRAPGWTTREVLLVRYSDHRVLPTRLGSPMMPPYDTVVRAILPAPPAAGAEKFSTRLPAGAAPDDVWHWFDTETILTLPEPVVTFVDAAGAVHQYPTRLARGRSLHRLVRDPRPDRIAGLPGDGHRLSPRCGPR
jgi:hypothetical protein